MERSRGTQAQPGVELESVPEGRPGERNVVEIRQMNLRVSDE